MRTPQLPLVWLVHRRDHEATPVATRAATLCYTPPTLAISLSSPRNIIQRLWAQLQVKRNSQAPLQEIYFQRFNLNLSSAKDETRTVRVIKIHPET